ncbi:MAG TPA: CarD family transcriptional regulator [Candidatus Limnocylindrales bacterium]|nr:CarD family transcriptional regulator [Candidatus Limnocylindrales bacterium]
MPGQFISPFEPGELIVHATHGISRYVGTRLLEAADGTTGQYFQLDYAAGDRVFVPVEHVARLSKYEGEEALPARLTAGERRTPYSRVPKPQ